MADVQSNSEDTNFSQKLKTVSVKKPPKNRENRTFAQMVFCTGMMIFFNFFTGCDHNRWEDRARLLSRKTQLDVLP
jgi:hypothetical protein